MKFNLKNRPKPKFDLGSPYCGGWLRTYTVWFEGFEKGLRKHLQAFIDEHAWPECSEFSVKETIKEILGENDQT